MSTDILKEQRNKRIISALRAQLQKVNRIISNSGVKVFLAPKSSSSSAWTDGQDVWLAEERISKDLRETTLSNTVMRVKGRNYHEVSHILFTPRVDTDIHKWLTANADTATWIELEPEQQWKRHLWRAWNVLEDQRIETLFTALYGPSAPYFRAAILEAVVKNDKPGALESMHGLLHGRKYISADTRRKAYELFAKTHGRDLADRVSKVINEYLLVTYPTNQLLAQACLKEMATIMAEISGNMNDIAPNTADQASRMRAGNQSKKQQDKAHEALGDPRDYDDEEDETEDGEPEGSDADGEEDESEGAEGEGDTDGDGESDAEGDGDGDDDAEGEAQSGKSGKGDADGDGESDDDDVSEGEPSPGIGEGPTTGTSNPTDDFIDAVDEELNDVLKDEEFVREVASIVRAIREMSESEVKMIDHPPAPAHQMAPPPEAVQQARRLADQLLRLKAEMDNERIRRQMAGVLDMRRVASRQPWETDIFRQYVPGEYDEAKAEVVVLVDLSGSMGSVMTQLSVALWTLCRALEAIDSRVTVIGYQSQTYAMYQPHERAAGHEVNVFGAGGGTVPDAALSTALAIFNGSRFARKAMISLTDGGWGGNREFQEKVMGAIRTMGVITCMVEMKSGAHSGNMHGHEFGVTMKDLRDLPRLATRMVDGLLRVPVG